MFRLTQILRNSFIRVEGLFGLVFKTLFSLLGSVFGFFTKVFGFTQSSYFVESDGAQLPVEPTQDQIPEPPVVTTRVRPETKKIDNYYLNMARDVKK
jgi:hypothetical protein